jgi:hypothetical protein
MRELLSFTAIPALDPLLLKVSFLLTSIICFLVKAWFLYRVRTATLCWLLTGVCAILWATGGAGMFAMSILPFGPINPATFVHHNRWLLIATMILDVVFGVVVSGIMSWSLWRRRSAQFMNTNGVVDKLILWAIRQCFCYSFMTEANSPYDPLPQRRELQLGATVDSHPCTHPLIIFAQSCIFVESSQRQCSALGAFVTQTELPSRYWLFPIA